MANLRIIYNNLTELTNSLTASTTSGLLVAANMKNESKVSVHRSTGTSVTYTLTWAENRKVGGLALPATNLTSAATIRVRLFSDEACTVTLQDSGTVTACPGWVQDVWGWSGAINANAFPYGGAAKTAVWFATHSTTVRGCKVDLVDSGNPAGFIDCARIVVGEYWEPTRNADYGVEVGVADTTVSVRNEAGDLKSDNGTMHDVLGLSLSALPESDRTLLWAILNNVGTRRNFFLSLLPGASPSATEREHMIYGRRSNSNMVFATWGAFANRVQMEGW